MTRDTTVYRQMAPANATVLTTVMVLACLTVSKLQTTDSRKADRTTARQLRGNAQQLAVLPGMCTATSVQPEVPKWEARVLAAMDHSTGALTNERGDKGNREEELSAGEPEAECNQNEGPQAQANDQEPPLLAGRIQRIEQPATYRHAKSRTATGRGRER